MLARRIFSAKRGALGLTGLARVGGRRGLASACVLRAALMDADLQHDGAAATHA
jgi:hypothetical protein